MQSIARIKIDLNLHRLLFCDYFVIWIEIMKQNVTVIFTVLTASKAGHVKVTKLQAIIV